MCLLRLAVWTEDRLRLLGAVKFFEVNDRDKIFFGYMLEQGHHLQQGVVEVFVFDVVVQVVKLALQLRQVDFGYAGAHPRKTEA
jgi:hypothetical protein